MTRKKKRKRKKKKKKSAACWSYCVFRLPFSAPRVEASWWISRGERGKKDRAGQRRLSKEKVYHQGPEVQDRTFSQFLHLLRGRLAHSIDRKTSDGCAFPPAVWSLYHANLQICRNDCLWSRHRQYFSGDTMASWPKAPHKKRKSGGFLSSIPFHTPNAATSS